MATPYLLHLSLNPYDSLPYLQYTHDVTEDSFYRFIVTISLPSTRSGSSRTRRRPMFRTTDHVPDFVTTLTFPADSMPYYSNPF